MKQGVYSLCLELKHWVYITRAIQNKAEQASKDTMYLSGLIRVGTLGVRVGSCLPPALPAFPGRLTGLFQGLLWGGYSLGNHTEWSPTLYSFCRSGIWEHLRGRAVSHGLS